MERFLPTGKQAQEKHTQWKAHLIRKIQQGMALSQDLSNAVPHPSKTYQRPPKSPNNYLNIRIEFRGPNILFQYEIILSSLLLSEFSQLYIYEF